jgi:hypothetical protein
MTRSIFDPTGGETERSGSTHLGAAADAISHIPPDLIDGKVENDDVESLEASVRPDDTLSADDTPASTAEGPIDMARRLQEDEGVEG